MHLTRIFFFDFLYMQVFLSVMWHGGYLGAAYYDDESAQVYLLRDVIERDSFILMKQCKKISMDV